jgi:uncharacterized protein YjiK
MYTKSILFILIFFASLNCLAQKYPLLKPIHKIGINGINEPSEIVLSQDGNSYYVLADKAFLYEFDLNGKLIKKLSFSGYDVEGACLIEDRLYISEESLRQIQLFNIKKNQLEKTIQLHYGGARNLGFESIVYLPDTKHFLVASEKAPCNIFEYSEDFQLLNQFKLKGIREISSMTYHDNKLYILSDEDAIVFKVNPANYSILAGWQFPIINPEGICFNKKNEMVVISDDMGKIFVFSNPNAN